MMMLNTVVSIKTQQFKDPVFEVECVFVGTFGVNNIPINMAMCIAWVAF